MNLALRFVRGTGWDSKVIEWGSRSWTSHVELFRDDRTFGGLSQESFRDHFNKVRIDRVPERSECAGGNIG
jgi:hypothetical protein